VSPPVNFQFSASTYNTGEGSTTVAVCVDASALFDRTFQVTVSAIPGTGTATGQWCMLYAYVASYNLGQ